MRYLPRTFPFKSNITGKDRWHGEPSLEAGKPGVGSHRRGKCLSIFLFVRESGESRKRWLTVILIKFFALELDYNSKPGHKSQTKQVSLRREAYDLAEERESSLERPTVFIELKMMTGEWIAEPLVKKFRYGTSCYLILIQGANSISLLTFVGLDLFEDLFYAFYYQRYCAGFTLENLETNALLIW